MTTCTSPTQTAHPSEIFPAVIALKENEGRCFVFLLGTTDYPLRGCKVCVCVCVYVCYSTRFSELGGKVGDGLSEEILPAKTQFYLDGPRLFFPCGKPGKKGAVAGFGSGSFSVCEVESGYGSPESLRFDRIFEKEKDE